MVWSTNLSGTPGDEEIDASDKVQTVIRTKSPASKAKKTSPTKKFEKIASPDSRFTKDDVPVQGIEEKKHTSMDKIEFQDTLSRQVVSPDQNMQLGGTQNTQATEHLGDLSVGLDKIVTQLDLVQKTLLLLENRITGVEDLALKLEGRMSEDK